MPSSRTLKPAPVSVGVSIPKLEAGEKVTGRARYVDDIAVPGVLHGRTVRSTVARGRIIRVELDPAFDWRGVVIADHKDIPGENVVALIADDQPLLAADEIRHAEEPILLVAHEDAERAEAARMAVRVEVEPLPAALTVEDALARTALVHGDDNVFKEITIERGDVERGLAESDLVVEGEYRTGWQEQLYIENNGMIAERDGDGLLVRGSLQCPYYVHKALMRIFALAPDRVRVIQTVTGGGFGGKEEYPSMIGGHAALLAWKSGRPVKIVYDRLEDIAATTKRHPSVTRMRVGVMKNGRLVAVDADILMDGGAYVTLSPVVLSRGAIHAAGAYRWRDARIHARAVATHTPPNGAFRGFGAPQTLFATECHLDRIAERLGMDPLALRLANAVRIGDVTPTGQVLKESVGAVDVLTRTAAMADWTRTRERLTRENAAAAAHETRRHRRRAAAPRPGSAPAPSARRLRRGIGLSLALHGAGFTGSGEVRLASRAAISLGADGRPVILTANTEIGQGTITAFSQLVGEALGVPPSFVIVHDPDTRAVPDSGPTVASRTVMVVGGLLEQCARAMRERLELFAETPIAGADEFRRVAKRFLRERGPLKIERQYEKPPGITWDDDTYRGDAYSVFSYAGCAVEVEVDLDTGETTVLNVATAHDIGRAIHPVLAAGQVEGGTVQALGWALLEDVRWKDGRVWNHQLTNYIIPTSADTPPIHVEFVDDPYTYGPRGAKGVGELPMDTPAPAVVAAIAHATGVRADEIPVTPERLLAALAAREKS
ncbi:MAG: xanthine dehydrogenase family protein [Candidatus Eisenbacteria bacterium]|uniref:Xanthine dehydrogenase family protein n=1 Tax=Eiseniibacteriota bacterium TaxID=2212470 RepID=A0A9D6L585_UNCEI|nr:xanthine dehydrogenase family protein [Candidatus Eisenbacteria bacterium]MBI3540072.1 xanthine dehydrogenase family protein [Candidatus Eisenbacteria bacterium]